MFHKAKTYEESKKLFRQLAMRLHPDHGGNDELMILLNEAYETKLYELEKIERLYEEQYEKTKKREMQREYPGEYQAIFDESCLEEFDARTSIIDEIIKYAKKHKKFDASYTVGIAKILKNTGSISAYQYNALVRIYYAFFMHRDESLKNKKTKKKK